MRIKIGARKSDLARWQAVVVARAFEKKASSEFIFKASLGDQNQDTPLSQMPAKGVFTEDFYEDLVAEKVDLVVHSWKDLPVEERADTHIAMTLPRADLRDILLVPESAWQAARQSGRLKILTSSPRRIYNLSNCLSQLLPGNLQCEFQAVRGNVPTRIRKMHEASAALVLAKAGLDRLLEGERDGYLQIGLRDLLKECRFQILPISLNPPAPAQGALAVEVLREKDEINQLCAEVTDEKTFACVKRERAVLQRYGGGCHQKIGVAVLPRPYGVVCSMRGLTDAGEVLHDWRIENSTPWVRASSAENIFPQRPEQNSWFKRQSVAIDESIKEAPGVFVARADAWPAGYQPPVSQMVWTAGVQTWMKLARQGVWVQGCQDGLGESEDMGLELLTGGTVEFTKLTHSGGNALVSQKVRRTYTLENKDEAPDLRGKTHFFWMSRTSFERARQLYPQEISEGRHACGPGLTFDFLKSLKNLKHPVKVFINLQQFLDESLP